MGRINIIEIIINVAKPIDRFRRIVISGMVYKVISIPAESVNSISGTAFLLRQKE